MHLNNLNNYNPNYNLTKEQREAFYSEWNSFTKEKLAFRIALLEARDRANEMGMSPELFLFEVNHALEPEEETDFEEDGDE